MDSFSIPIVFLWVPMDSYAFLWILMDSFGFRFDSYRNAWISIELVALYSRITPA